MAQRRGFPGRTLVRSQRRKTAWGLGPNANTILITAIDAPQQWTNGVVLLNEQEVTIVRIRGNFHAVLTAVSSTHGGFAAAAGLGLVTLEAFNAGIASNPSPITDADWDGWMWHSFFDVRSITATIADGVNAFAISRTIEIDSKAMRKFNTDMVLFGAVEARFESGSASLVVDADSRVLVKLS